jgi:hypothetical protein
MLTRQRETGAIAVISKVIPFWLLLAVKPVESDIEHWANAEPAKDAIIKAIAAVTVIAFFIKIPPV